MCHLYRFDFACVCYGRVCSTMGLPTDISQDSKCISIAYHMFTVTVTDLLMYIHIMYVPYLYVYNSMGYRTPQFGWL